MNRIIAFALIISCPVSLVRAQSSGQSTLSPDASEQRSIDQLRAIAENIKKCQLPPMPADPSASEGFKDVYGPPMNVVWNVELHPSVRSRYVGSIEFAEPSYYEMPLDDRYCNKPNIKKAECKRMWLIGVQMYRRDQTHPFQFRYEFDVAARSLELVSVFDKMTHRDSEPWVAGDVNSDACAGNAIRSVLGSPNAAEQKSTTRSALSDPAKLPPGIPEALWNAANLEDEDAQFDLGHLYAEGEGVPQDYVEAYFWFDIAASGKVPDLRRNEMVKSRDGSASRLTPSVLLRTQERARQWFEDHPPK
jgi:hypothetical protein